MLPSTKLWLDCRATFILITIAAALFLLFTTDIAHVNATLLSPAHAITVNVKQLALRFEAPGGMEAAKGIDHSLVSFVKYVQEEFGFHPMTVRPAIRQQVLQAIEDGRLPFGGFDLGVSSDETVCIDFMRGSSFEANFYRSYTRSGLQRDPVAMHDLLSMLKVTGTTGSREPLLMMQVTGVLPLVSTSVDLGRFGSLKLKLFRGDTITEALNRSLPPWLPENAVAAARAHLEDKAMLARAFGAFWEPRNSPLPSGFESDPAFVPFTSVEVFGDDEGREHHHSALGVVMPRKGWMCNGHLFHVLDCMLPAFAWVREYFPDEDPDAIVFVPALYSDRFHGTVARAIFPGARIVTSGRVTIERGVAVEPEEAVAHRPWGVDVGSWNLFEMSMEPVRLWMPEFVDRVLRHSDASHSPRPRAPGEVRAVYLSREDSIREISPSLRAAIVTRLLEVHGVTCHVVAIDGGASLEEQVRLFAEVDLLVGLHGNGLSNLLWVPHHGAVLELFPTEFHHYHYQLLSEMRGLQYVGIQEDNPQPYRRGSRRDDFYGPLPFVPESLDWDVFDREIKYILRRMLHGRLSVQDI